MPYNKIRNEQAGITTLTSLTLKLSLTTLTSLTLKIIYPISIKKEIVFLLEKIEIIFGFGLLQM